MTTKRLFDLDGRTALVTGASRGLGFRIAEALGELGARVTIVSRKQSDIDNAAEVLRSRNIDAIAIQADLADPESAKTLVASVVERFGKIDILVNNAAASWAQPAEDHDWEGWRKVMALNVDGVFRLTQEVGRQAMIPAKSGRILNIASIGGLRGNRPEFEAFTLAYSTSKGATANFTRALASEWGRYGIAVNALCPGYFRSKLASGLLDRIGDQVAAATPLGGIADDSDFKGAAAFLCSDASRHMTGQMLVVDGGMSAC